MLMVLIGQTSFSVTALLKSCLVITWKRYWFVTAYVLMYMTAPILNIVISALSQKQYRLLCASMLTVFSIIPNITLFGSDFSGVANGASYLWFCVLYLISGYFRRFIPAECRRQKMMLPIWALSCAVIAGNYFVDYFHPLFCGGVIFLPNNSVITVIGSMAFFQFFRGAKLKPISERAASACAPLVFSVYLIHMQKDFRPILWNFSGVKELANEWFAIPYFCVVVLMIFAGSCLIDSLRRKVFDIIKLPDLLMKYLDRVQEKIELHIE